mmetsp:Transcript_18639/g.40579  ORF Transcript_18639/g.40579 Transcript_18639/m.40579 type:complete len:355 (-) Transcript_18639:416-1480(-)|eukprot:CAMPEP_0168195564 /NCGR_PEP_ID=MMETSP0139_2-20121125/19922_1 /TAXON_ID=44445 /ORGANISM="Pseudo-nitzschia australis, Strain 10249 10 AB" /LENGTH=354 /DNA_ID=CAMNT_0008119425 /DNA_START=226 /DNA_END=1290 /DNA_ORIENTATION=-
MNDLKQHPKQQRLFSEGINEKLTGEEIQKCNAKGMRTATKLQSSEASTLNDLCQIPKEELREASLKKSSAPGSSSVVGLNSLSVQKKDVEDITSVISHVVGRVCEGSVASDVSGLTDADIFRTDDFHTPPNNMYPNKNVGKFDKNNNYKILVRAPEPPAVSGGVSKLTDIESETTSTTLSSTHEERTTEGGKKRSVSFCEVQVRNYERILEVNPSVTSGPALGIGWNYSPDEDEIFSLENFEETREHIRRHSMEDLALPRCERESILQSLGYTQKEIAGSVRTIIRVKNQRKQTIHNLHASSVEEFVEMATRKVKRVLLFPLHKRKKVKHPKKVESSVLRRTSLNDSRAAAAKA